MRILRNLSFFFVIAIAITVFATWLDSLFLFTYLRTNLIGLLITLLAINTATTGLIASKMQELVSKHPKINFQNSIKEMKFSLFEQIVLIAGSVFVLILIDSKVVSFHFKDLVFDGVLIAIFIYALDILWDTGKSVFVVIELITKASENKE